MSIWGEPDPNEKEGATPEQLWRRRVFLDRAELGIRRAWIGVTILALLLATVVAVLWLLHDWNGARQKSEAKSGATATVSASSSAPGSLDHPEDRDPARTAARAYLLARLRSEPTGHWLTVNGSFLTGMLQAAKLPGVTPKVISAVVGQLGKDLNDVAVDAIEHKIDKANDAPDTKTADGASQFQIQFCMTPTAPAAKTPGPPVTGGGSRRRRRQAGQCPSVKGK